jgi:hypothetical protein
MDDGTTTDEHGVPTTPSATTANAEGTPSVGVSS